MLILLIANLIVLPVAIAFFNDDLSLHWVVFNTISDTVFPPRSRHQFPHRLSTHIQWKKTFCTNMVHICTQVCRSQNQWSNGMEAIHRCYFLEHKVRRDGMSWNSCHDPIRMGSETHRRPRRSRDRGRAIWFKSPPWEENGYNTAKDFFEGLNNLTAGDSSLSPWKGHVGTYMPNGYATTGYACCTKSFRQICRHYRIAYSTVYTYADVCRSESMQSSAACVQLRTQFVIISPMTLFTPPMDLASRSTRCFISGTRCPRGATPDTK